MVFLELTPTARAARAVPLRQYANDFERKVHEEFPPVNPQYPLAPFIGYLGGGNPGAWWATGIFEAADGLHQAFWR